MIRKIFALSLILGAASATTARANEGEGPCKADAEKLCAGIEPGEGRIVKCLKEHEAQVSPACKAKWEAKKEQHKEKRLKKLEERKVKIEQKIEELKK